MSGAPVETPEAALRERIISALNKALPNTVSMVELSDAATRILAALAAPSVAPPQEPLLERAQAVMDAADTLSYIDSATLLDHRGAPMPGYVAVREEYILDLDSAVEELRPLVEAAAPLQEPAAPRCDCGTELTQCSGCAVADYQSGNVDCPRCCIPAGEMASRRAAAPPAQSMEPDALYDAWRDTLPFGGMIAPREAFKAGLRAAAPSQSQPEARIPEILEAVRAELGDFWDLLDQYDVVSAVLRHARAAPSPGGDSE